MFLDDPALLDWVEADIAGGENAEWAWHDASEHFAARLEALTDETLRARAADIRDVSRRVIQLLLASEGASPSEIQGVLVARDLSPSQTTSLDTSRVAAFCTAEGGPTSHTAILARALGISAVVGLGEAVMEIDAGTFLLVDGTRGEVIAAPDTGKRPPSIQGPPSTGCGTASKPGH